MSVAEAKAYTAEDQRCLGRSSNVFEQLIRA